MLHAGDPSFPDKVALRAAGLMGDPENWNSSSFDMDGNEYSGVVMSLLFTGVCVVVFNLYVCVMPVDTASSRRCLLKHVDRSLNISVL